VKPAPRYFVSIFLALAVAALSVPVLADTHCRRPGTPLEAKALAEKAAAHLADVGLGKAFTDFMSPGAGFMPYDLYVFVFDGGGRMWVNGRFPGLIGSNATTARDSNGRNFLLEAMRRAERDGSAWVEYQWYNPCTGRPMAKSSHVIRAGRFFIGVGAYGRLSVKK
jgi:cytochrome c